MKVDENLLINFIDVTDGQTDVQDIKTRCGEGKAYMFIAFCRENAQNTSPLPFPFSSHLNTITLSNLMSKGGRSVERNNHTLFLSSVVTIKQAVAEN